MGQPTLVVQAGASLSEMATSHSWVSLLPWSSPRLWSWHSSGGHAGTFTSLFTHYLSQLSESYAHHRRRRGNIACTPASRSCARHLPPFACSNVREAYHRHRQ